MTHAARHVAQEGARWRLRPSRRPRRPQRSATDSVLGEEYLNRNLLGEDVARVMWRVPLGPQPRRVARRAFSCVNAAKHAAESAAMPLSAGASLSRVCSSLQLDPRGKALPPLGECALLRGDLPATLAL